MRKLGPLIQIFTVVYLIGVHRDVPHFRIKPLKRFLPSRKTSSATFCQPSKQSIDVGQVKLGLGFPPNREQLLHQGCAVVDNLARLFTPGPGTEGQGKRSREAEVLHQTGGEFPWVDVPYPHVFQVFHGVAPESLQRLARVERAIAQGVELGVSEPVFGRQALPQARVGLLPFVYPASETDAALNTKHFIEPFAGGLPVAGKMEPGLVQPRLQTFPSSQKSVQIFSGEKYL